jgi:hypothetical protein
MWLIRQNGCCSPLSNLNCDLFDFYDYGDFYQMLNHGNHKNQINHSSDNLLRGLIIHENNFHRGFLNPQYTNNPNYQL